MPTRPLTILANLSQRTISHEPERLSGVIGNLKHDARIGTLTFKHSDTVLQHDLEFVMD
jgi:hypothetical protein